MKHKGVAEAYGECLRLIRAAKVCRKNGKESAEKMYVRMALVQWKFARRVSRIVRGVK